jgi:hypothetical protein
MRTAVSTSGRCAALGQGLAIFCDIGATLASPVVDGGRLARLDVYPFVPEVLVRLRAVGGARVRVVEDG